MIRLDLSNAALNQELQDYQDEVSKCHRWIREKSGRGNDYIGWLDWPDNYDREEFDRILKTTESLKGKYDVVLVCGIGGSYLGTRAAEEMIKGLLPAEGPKMIYIGNTFSHTYISQVLDYIKEKDVVLNVISKSGTTTETALAFRIFKNFLYEKYGEDAKQRILVTTDRKQGTLKALADREGYQTFVIPDAIGGRYSVFTAVGLLPLALGGIDIKAILEGSLQASKDYACEQIADNPAYQYAVARRILNKQGYDVEMFVTYHSQLTMLAEWWKQLFGESEGKEDKAVLPASACFSTDLHSLGQFIQQGTKGILYETVFHIDDMPGDFSFPADENDFDHMNYLAGKKLSWVNSMAAEGTLKAHAQTGGVPNIVIHLKDNSAYSFGYMIYFFFMACAMSCYLLDINPFDQPGVEIYKKEMFSLLGKE